MNINYEENPFLFHAPILTLTLFAFILKVTTTVNSPWKPISLEQSKMWLISLTILIFFGLEWTLFLYSPNCSLMTWIKIIHEKLQLFTCIATKFFFFFLKCHLTFLDGRASLQVWCVSSISDCIFVEEKELVWLESDSTMGISKMSIQNQVGCRERG